MVMANRPNSIFPSYGSKTDIEKIDITVEDEILEVEYLEETILRVQTYENLINKPKINENELIGDYVQTNLQENLQKSDLGL